MALAIFDLDETLINGDCASLWSSRMGSLGWVDSEAFMRENGALMSAYSQGRLAMEDYMAFSLAPMKGRRQSQVAPLIETFIDEVIEPLIYDDAREAVERHRKANDRVLVISASGDHLVRPIAARLSIADVLAIDLDIFDGCYTGQTRGVLTYREGKAVRLEDWMRDQQESYAGSSFYSDSRNDLPRLCRVENARAVNPDPTLFRYAVEADWPVLSWR